MALLASELVHVNLERRTPLPTIYFNIIYLSTLWYTYYDLISVILKLILYPFFVSSMTVTYSL